MAEERKLVTIIFADVTNSTQLGEMLDPENVRALMGRYYAHARRIVADHGGTIEKFIGDAVMAVFGLPQAHGDDAERALAAALALRATITEDAVLSPYIHLRLGVNTGEVVATTDTSQGDFLITGDAVNVTARLQQTAQPDEIVAGVRTMQAARQRYLFSPTRTITVKGKAQPLLVATLEGPRAIPLIERPPFVGRATDLVQMRLLLTRAEEEQRPQFLTISAPAGSGKSRLVEEFLDQIVGEDTVRVAFAHCLPYGQALTFWPLFGLLSHILREPPNGDNVATIFARHGFAAEESARFATNVRAILGAEREVPADREGVFSTWRVLCELLAREQPLIIVVEDIHWASESLLDLLEYLIHRSANAAFMGIFLTRPELADRRPTWGGGRQNGTTIALPPLPAAITTQLVEGIAPNLDAPQRTQIVAQSGGNPFFAQELARSATLPADDAASNNVLPDTVHAAILARIDQQPALARSLMQVAAVAGREVSLDLLTAVLDLTDRSLLVTSLDDLVASDLLVQTSGTSYAFVHALIRDVLYGTLARQERIRLHSRIAARLEERASNEIDTYSELLAYHYREAVLLGRQSAIPVALPIETERAVHFLRRAGILASRAGVRDEAMRYLEEALELAPPDLHMSVYEQMGDAEFGGEHAYGHYRQALALWEVGDQQDVLTGAQLTRKVMESFVRGYVRLAVRPDEATTMTLLAQGQDLAERANATTDRYYLEGVAFFLDWQRGARAATQVDAFLARVLAWVDVMEREQRWHEFDLLLDMLGAFYAFTNQFAEARQVQQRRLSQTHLAVTDRLDAMNSLSLIDLIQGNYHETIAHVQAMVAQLRPDEPVMYLISAINNAVTLAWDLGEWDVISDLAQYLDDAAEQMRGDMSLVSTVASAYLWVLKVAVARDDHPMRDATLAALKRHLNDEQARAAIFADALVHQRLSTLVPVISTWPDATILPAMMELTESGIPMALRDIERARLDGANIEVPFIEVWRASARALATHDAPSLAAAIAQAERHQMIYYAARMRVHLARMALDAVPLALARPRFEQLHDRRSLREVDEVAHAIAAGQE